jgi:hypothetical protein
MVELFKPLKTFNFQPQIVKEIIKDENGEPVKEGEDGKVKIGKEDVLPLDIVMYQDYEKESFPSFNQAADEFYSGRLEQISRRFKRISGRKKWVNMKKGSV